jgi:stage V sporulation protein R
MPNRLIEGDELINYADENSKIMATSRHRLNPYKLGVELFRHIMHCWDTGRHGKEYDECENMEQKLNWNTREGKGLEKIVQIRRCYNDIMFLDEFFTEDFFRTQKYFMHDDDGKGVRRIVSREFMDVKDMLMNALTNHGMPMIYVVDSNFKNRGELQLYHKWTGMQLRRDYAESVLKGISKIWKRPVCIETIIKDSDRLKNVRIRYTGEKIEEESGSSVKFT